MLADRSCPVVSGAFSTWLLPQEKQNPAFSGSFVPQFQQYTPVLLDQDAGPKWQDERQSAALSCCDMDP